MKEGLIILALLVVGAVVYSTRRRKVPRPQIGWNNSRVDEAMN